MSLTEFDIAQLESRYDALDSPSTLCIRVPPPLAWGRNSVRELREQKRHVLGDGGRGSILTASLFPCTVRPGKVPAVDYVQRQQYKVLLLYKIPGTGTYVVRVVSVSYEKHEMRVFATAARKILHSLLIVYGSSKMKSQAEGAKASIFEPKKKKA